MDASCEAHTETKHAESDTKHNPSSSKGESVDACTSSIQVPINASWAEETEMEMTRNADTSGRPSSQHDERGPVDGQIESQYDGGTEAVECDKTGEEGRAVRETDERLHAETGNRGDKYTDRPRRAYRNARYGRGSRGRRYIRNNHAPTQRPGKVQYSNSEKNEKSANEENGNQPVGIGNDDLEMPSTASGSDATARCDDFQKTKREAHPVPDDEGEVTVYSFSPPPINMRLVADQEDPLSIYFVCDMQVCGKRFWSLEQAYQWCKAMYVRNMGAAKAVYTARRGTKTTTVANRFYSDRFDWTKWNHPRIPVMKQMLRAKARCCKEFSQELQDSGDSYIAMVIKDDKSWGIGDGKGKNMVGSLLMELRSHLDEAIKADPEEDKKVLDFCAGDEPATDAVDVLVIGNQQLSGINCEHLVSHLIIRKRIVPSIEETHQFIENEDISMYEAIVLHLLSEEVSFRPKEEVLEEMSELIDAIIKRMRTPKIIISLAVYPCLSPDEEYSKKADALNRCLFDHWEQSNEVFSRTNGLRLKYRECFTSDGHLSQKAEKILRYNLKDTISHHLVVRKANNPVSEPREQHTIRDSQPETECTYSENDKATKESDAKGQATNEKKVQWIIPVPVDLKVVLYDAGDPLSNLYSCDMYVFGMDFWSSEQAFQWAKAICMRNTKAADEIYNATYAKKATEIANRYFSNADMSRWLNWRLSVMKQLLRAKARDCQTFRNVLQNTDNSYIVTIIKNDTYWGIGNGMGSNVMGCLLMELRSNLDEALNADPDEDGKMPDFTEGEEQKDNNQRDKGMTVLLVGNAQLNYIDCKNLLPGVKIEVMITSSIEMAHQFIENKDISDYVAIVLHLLSKEEVEKNKDDVLDAMQKLVDLIKHKTDAVKVIISLAVYPIRSPNDEYSQRADALNTAVFKTLCSTPGVFSRRNGLYCKYEECFTDEGTLSRDMRRYLQKNLADTMYYHLCSQRRVSKRKNDVW